MEAVSEFRIARLEDATPLADDGPALETQSKRDGFLYFRRLLPAALVMNLRQIVLEYAADVDWLDPDRPRDDAPARPGKRIGFYEDPEWIQLQVHTQMSREMWNVGEFAGIHQVLQAASGGRASYLYLSTANTCRVFSPHPDMATQPHQDAHYVKMLGDFWTAWIPLGDCPLELGPLAVLPGSHRSGLRPHSGVGIVQGGADVSPDIVWHTADFACGDVLLFTWHTLHRSLPNRSGNQLRLSADFRYGFWNETPGDSTADCGRRQ